ncbi:MAG TPA: hypothetical protein VFR71_03060 [Methyloceanibacter sp.]|nr:hypothetical protein [Methyloceanibacter sp.]
MAANPNIETLLEVFDEPLRDPDRRGVPPAQPALPASGQRSVRPQREANGPAQLPAAAPATPSKGGPTVKGLVATLVGISLVPMAILFVLLWQDMMRPRVAHEAASAEPASTASLAGQSGSTQPKHAERPPLEIALSSPERIEANTGDMVEFPIAIDATDALPARSIVSVIALPEGASFSAGRPYGVSGWSLRPNEIGSLQLRLPERSAASDLHLELVAGDGTVLAQSETRLSIAAASPEVETTGTIDSAPPVQIARAEKGTAGADLVSLPQRNPQASTGDASGLKVNTVKVVTIEPPKPNPTRPHDGAYGLGSPADDAQGEWMVTKTAVDMHAKAQQSSETVKVADKGLKLRVTARDKRWIQVTDPATSTTGWIYDRFLQPAEPPAR